MIRRTFLSLVPAGYLISKLQPKGNFVSNFWQDLFASYGATAGGAYDFTDLSTLFQDTSGTVPVASAGDPIALVADKSGLGNHFTQSSSVNQPLYFIDQQGNGSAHFNASAPSYMDGSGLNCDQVTCWQASYYLSTAGGRVLDTRGTGTLGTVKGWVMGAGDSASINLFTVDDGAGHYLYDDPRVFLNNNLSASVSFYINGNTQVFSKAVTMGGDRTVYAGSSAFKGVTLGDITSAGACRMGAPVNTTTTQRFNGYLYACGSIGAVLKASDRDAILDYLRDIAQSI